MPTPCPVTHKAYLHLVSSIQIIRNCVITQLTVVVVDDSLQCIIYMVFVCMVCVVYQLLTE